MRGLSKRRYSSMLCVAVLLSSHAGQQEEAMFLSKQRPIAIPQWEQQKLAGTLLITKLHHAKRQMHRAILAAGRC